MRSVKTPINYVSKVNGISWWNITMGVLLLAFVLYLAASGSLPKYKKLLLG